MTAQTILGIDPGALGLPIVFLTPPTWKRDADIPPGAENKDLARTCAVARWPARSDLFARKCDVDRAEAFLIALAGLRREARAMSERERLPNRRLAELVDFKQGHPAMLRVRRDQATKQAEPGNA
jgi:hypothetical protein